MAFSDLSNLTAVTNDEAKLLATPGIAAVLFSLVAEIGPSKSFSAFYELQQSF